MNRFYQLALVIFGLGLAQFAFACGNEFFQTPTQLPRIQGRPDLSRLLSSTDKTFGPYWNTGFGENINAGRDSLLVKLAAKAHLYPESLDDKYDQIIERSLQADQYQLLSDFAWYEVRVGNLKKAITLLEALYKAHPKEYNIVANLGTAYELAGDLPRALEFIKRAVEIDPASHYRSEWIHVNILEQKISSNPDYTRIINLGIKNFADWIADDKYVFSQIPDSLKAQIAYQLHERISFVEAPDPIVAQLVLDFADIVAKQDGTNAALPFYDYAATYGNQQMSAVIANRKQVLSTTKKEIEGTFRRAAIIWAIPLLALVFIFIAWLRSLRKNRA